MLKCSYEFYKMWDTHFTVPTFEFYFKFPIPKPNKERIIFERDRLGKIKSSKCLKGLYYKEFNTGHEGLLDSIRYLMVYLFHETEGVYVIKGAY